MDRGEEKEKEEQMRVSSGETYEHACGHSFENSRSLFETVFLTPFYWSYDPDNEIFR